MFVFPHNALRAELLDMAYLGLTLQSLDIHCMSMWWRISVTFLNKNFQFEDKVVLFRRAHTLDADDRGGRNMRVALQGVAGG